MAKDKKESERMPSRGGMESESEGMDTELHKLFLDELSDIYDAEQQLTKALPKVAKAAQSEELRDALEQHLEETEEHISRLEEVAESLDANLKSKTCKAMKGLIEEVRRNREGTKRFQCAGRRHYCRVPESGALRNRHLRHALRVGGTNGT